ncbi:GNAT family N-acetyltransferase [Trabulsiella odontotermitis]|uniref:GNAT family N-acetyltransferase n=1 Tax=Trabulsiella odontotermitis TaxID=379893 RepID=UPI0024B80C9D|nr:GNAT family N-acetyltransferase [Trabulsiella odontotermitis]WHP30724.1 GNAT family N-acetyltransferase [Trabulsiella odontotermitis]
MKSNTFPDAILFRRTQNNDVPALPAIERSAGQTFLTIPSLAWLAQDDIVNAATHHQYAERGQSWVAVHDQQPIGFLLLEPLDDALYIAEFSLHQAWQGKGIGRRFLHFICDHAREAGYPALTLTTFREVPWNAPFYAQLGFEIVDDARLAPGLAAKRETETAHGIPRESRCAMRRTL